MEETFTHPLTGEFFNRNELNNIYNMQYEAKVIWEPEFDAGNVSKEVVEKYFTYVYEAVDKEDRDKVIQEILSPNLKVEFKEPETWPLEESTDSDEDYDTQSEEENKAEAERLQKLGEEQKNSDNLAERRWANVGVGDLDSPSTGGGIITDPSRVTTGDLSPYTPD